MSNALAVRYAKPVPRYTSYPTAPHFHPGVDDDVYRGWLAALPEDATLSLYLHVPFCDRLCWFCGCNTKQTNRYAPVAAYLESLYAEIRAVAARLDCRGRVVAMHLGGGSPSMLLPADFDRLARLLRQGFAVDPAAEFSIEIDPNDMDEARYDALAEIGINRVSLGVQDFNPAVQVAINRIQSFEQTKAVVDAMRARGVVSVNLDVLYGLPYQTVEFVEATVDQALSLEPDRMAIFGYAHVPWMKPHQKMIEDAALPGIEARFEQSAAAAARIGAHGYEPIGMDHFAKPSDSLAIAARTGCLHRNFQGYTTDAATALIGLGASAIGKLPQGYVQNEVPTAQYARKVADRGTAIARGVALTPDDGVRGYVIERLMCDFAVSATDLQTRFGADAASVIEEMQAIAADDPDALVEFSGQRLVVTPRGRPFVRSIAARFDAYLQLGAARHSLAV
ncbi:MAG: oxygen-independent coproporphyrinogen III oxidase [Devosia sp.]|nr:oxygen-independent coproporphyrinogen III oxidase [Devosia sp.]